MKGLSCKGSILFLLLDTEEHRNAREFGEGKTTCYAWVKLQI